MSDWLPYFAAAVALLGAGIAFGQWYTARSRLALDLFEKRLEVYRNVSDVMGRVMREGTADTEDVIGVARQRDAARFLFGDDVVEYLASLQKALARLGYCRSVMAQLKGDEEYHRAVELQHRTTSEFVVPFYDDFGRVLRPYMRMHHRLPLWRLREWNDARTKKGPTRPSASSASTTAAPSSSSGSSA